MSPAERLVDHVGAYRADSKPAVVGPNGREGGTGEQPTRTPGALHPLQLAEERLELLISLAGSEDRLPWSSPPQSSQFRRPSLHFCLLACSRSCGLGVLSLGWISVTLAPGGGLNTNSASSGRVNSTDV